MSTSISVADRQIVEEIVEEFVSKGWQFTAYNITTEAKKRGADDRHRNLKRAVHSMFSNDEIDGYTRDLVNIKSVGAKAYLYSPTGSDVDEYDEDADADANASLDDEDDMSIGIDTDDSELTVD